MEFQELDSLVIENPHEHGIRKHEYKSLTLFCADSPPKTEIEKKTRGTIFQGDECLLRSMPFCKEIIVDENAYHNITNALSENSSHDALHHVLYRAIEGTIIRLIHVKSEGQWYITTHKKLNAYQSKWGNEKSFGDLFELAIQHTTKKTLNEFFKCLNTDYQYTFLLTTTKKTRLVCSTPESIIETGIPQIFLYVVTSNSGTLYIDPITSSITIGIPLQPELVLSDSPLVERSSETSRDQLANAIIKYVKSVDPLTSQGILLLDIRTLQSIKFVNQDYFDLFQIRGGHIPSIPFAYLNIISDADKVKKFKQICYPDELEILSKYDKIISDICNDIKKLYIQRYVEKDISMRTDTIKHNILKKIREQRVNINNMYNAIYILVMQLPPTSINKLIKQILIDEKRNVAMKLNEFIAIKIE